MAWEKRGKYVRTFAINVTTTVVQLLSENPKRVMFVVYNNGSATVYLLSAQNQTASDGIPLAPGASYNDDETIAALWVVAASGTQNLRVMVSSAE